MAKPMDFDPNKEGREQPRWATYVPSRRGAAFRTYPNVGHAKNSIGGRGILYEHVEGRWVEHFRIDPNDPAHQESTACDECSYVPDENDWSDKLYRKWVQRGTNRWTRARLCSHCNDFVR